MDVVGKFKFWAMVYGNIISEYYNYMSASAIEIALSAPIPIPQKCPNATRSSRQMSSSPANPSYGNIYVVEAAVAVNDPSIVNTPPSEFMNNLKERMNAYFIGHP